MKGTFAGLRGDATVDPTGSIRGRLVIDAATVDTGNQKRDTHLRSDDFFAVTRYPEIVFELNDVALGPDQHRLNGTLHVIGNRQPLDLTARVTDQDAAGLTLHVTTTLDRSRWGVTFRKNGMVNMDTALDITARFNRVA